MSEIIIYKSDKNQIQVEVEFDGETVWLSQQQLSQLFNQTKQNISLHINNCFREGELDSNSVVKESLTTASDGKKYKTKNYNLDVIISVGYRVKSKQGTHFRIWANSILKEYLVKGYTVNEKRLAQKEQEVYILKNGIQILSRVIEEKAANNEWLVAFAKGLSLLDDYDHEKLDAKGLTKQEAAYPSLNDYQKLISQMLSEYDSNIFGKEKDESFQSSIAQIAKGFGDDDFYPTLEEKATMLL